MSKARSNTITKKNSVSPYLGKTDIMQKYTSPPSVVKTAGKIERPQEEPQLLFLSGQHQEKDKPQHFDDCQGRDVSFHWRKEDYSDGDLLGH